MTQGPKKVAAGNGRFDAHLSLRTPKEVRDSLEAYASAEKIKLSPAASQILEDWLRTHGWLRKGDHPKPVGPATDAVDEMEKAIEGDRAKKGRAGKG